MNQAPDGDDWLATLSAVAQAEEPHLGPRWDALAQGALLEHDVATLRAFAAATPNGARAWAAFAPRDGALDDAIAASILAQQSRSPAPVIPIITAPSSRRRRLWMAATGLAIAAGILLFALRGNSTLPRYALDNLAGEQEMRGQMTAVEVVYGSGSQIDLVLRPAIDVTEPRGVRVFHQRGAALTPLAKAPTQTANGIFRLRGVVDAVLPPAPGPQRLIFVIAPPSALPKSVDAMRDGLLNAPHGWQLLQHDYRRR